MKDDELDDRLWRLLRRELRRGDGARTCEGAATGALLRLAARCARDEEVPLRTFLARAVRAVVDQGEAAAGGPAGGPAGGRS